MPENFKHYLLSTYMGFLLATANLSSVPFVYRYLVLCRQYTVSNLILFLIYSVALVPNLTSAVFYSVLVDKYSHTVVEAVRNRSSDCLTEAEWTTSYSGYSISDLVGILNALLT